MNEIFFFVQLFIRGFFFFCFGSVGKGDWIFGVFVGKERELGWLYLGIIKIEGEVWFGNRILFGLYFYFQGVKGLE